ncbi:MAG: CPBP family intramembrane metalloprotease [Ruminococcaceae bacterium]|nr:CPBP family intramembrane metalloprotease [Oscillospiraceae bacterium]
MKCRGLKMLGVTAVCAAFVPLAALACRPFVETDKLRFAVFAVFYTLLLAASAFYLRGKTVEKRELAVAAAAAVLTLFYTIPLMPIAVYAAVVTGAAFLVLCQQKKIGAPVRWLRRSRSENLWLFGGITVFYVCVCGFRYGFRFAFFPIDVLQCLAPAVSEEIVFRGVLTAALFRLFRLDDEFSANAWVFITLTIPFAFLHFPDAVLSGDALFARSFPIFFNTAVCYWLTRKHGLVYAVYAHALCDYLIFMTAHI